MNYFILGLNVVVCCVSLYSNSHIKTAVDTQLTFDIDLARSQFLEETRFMWISGCQFGAIDVGGVSRKGFDPEGPAVKCADAMAQKEEYLLHVVRGLGRR